MLVADGLGDLKGINDVKASHEKGTVTVDFDESKVTLDNIKKAIEKEGYTAK